MALILITHDMGVIAETAENVNVMYAGQVVENREVNRLFKAPRHPYTHALLQALPERSRNSGRLHTIPGVVPGLYDRPNGCLFSPRCANVQDQCRIDQPQIIPDGDGQIRCLYPIEYSE